jgi:hypothetical protein
MLFLFLLPLNFSQFNVSNTLPDTVLEQVSVIMQPQADDTGLSEDFIIPIPMLPTSTTPSIVYVSFTRERPDEYALGSFACTLKFISKEVDPSTGEPEEEGYEDEYQLEEIELSAGGDYIIPTYATFGSEWDRLKSGISATETFALSAMDSIKGKTISRLRLAAADILPQLLVIQSWKSSTWNPLEGPKTPHSPPSIRCICRV